MPMRYEIRNEYSLADPELYRAADKDDPEALLEGVAMAGLVGVLRQLGDLAEFAAEIFHNLHEEVMSTAARGHGLMIRVKQLETEVPSIERAFLSQTDHSSFFYRAVMWLKYHAAGVDWHPNLRIDQNLVTQGDLPRFIMDSYEECRAPPRLFLLDKFDVAGAGACLKRYTDPSFFKVETSGMTSADVQREKKIRKAKKKGPRWKNGETPEVLPTSHTKLHQLFLEERVENGVRNPSRRVKLKRRLNGFPFDSKTGKSYMEKLLKSPSPDHKVLHEFSVNSSPLMLATNDHNESGLEVLEVRSVSPDRESVGRKRSPPPSPDREEIMLNPSMYEPSKVPIDDKICEVPNSYPSIATDGISSTLDKVTGEKVIAVDAESNREGSLTGYQSDDIASEVDNYADAPSTMESEMDTDSEVRVKGDFTSSHIQNEPLISNANEENLHTRSSDSQSTGDSTISDEGNSSRQEMSSFSSDSPSTSAENPQSAKFSAKGFPSADLPEIEIVDASSYQKTADEDFPVDQHSKPVVSDDTCTDTHAITNHKSDFEQLTSSLCSNESTPNLAHSDSEGVVRKGILKGRESDETVSSLGDEEKKTNLVIDPPCSPSVSDSESLPGDDSPTSSAGEHLVDEPNSESVPCISTVPDIHCHTTDSSVKISWDLLHEDESNQDDRNLVENTAFTLDMFNVLSQNTNGTPEMISSKNLIPGKLDNVFPKLPENFPSDYPDMVHIGDNIKSTVSKGENLINELDNEDSNVPTESPDHAEDNHSNSFIDNQISSETFILSHIANSPDWPRGGLDAHEGNVIPEEETAVNETLALGTPKSCEVVGLQGTGITHHISPNDSEAQESSCCTPEDLEEPAGTSDTVEMGGITLCTSSTGREVTEISGSADLKTLNEVHVLLDESDSEADKSNTADMASAVPAVSDNAIIDNVHLPVGVNKLVQEHIHFFEDSGLDELENYKNCHGESGLVEKVGQTKAATSGFETVFCNTINNDHPKSEVSGTVPNSHLDLEVDQGLEFDHAATNQSLVEQSVLDREQEIFQQSGLVNHVSDGASLPIDYDTEESIVQEKIGLPPSQHDQELLHSGEMSSELSPLLPINHQQMLDHDDHKGDNDSASAFSLVDYRSPPSVSELPRPSNHDFDVPGYPKDPLGSIFPPSNRFSETNQINLADLPPLPPLPPVQWRMGKLQLASYSTEGEMMKHKELFPQLISPSTASTDDVSSSPPTASTDDAGSSPPTASTDDVGSSPPHPPMMLEMKHSLIQIVPETASLEVKVENSCSSMEANAMHDTIHLPPKIENQKQQFVVPTSESEFTSPAEEDKVANGSQTVKLPGLAILLSMKKVTERVRPQIQKVDERDSLLEQIRTKSFNLKPAMALRPSIRGPNTNLKVAAILEKANAIRQALAGSDEDDDDSWSDS
ncbi:hypothetical protein Pfo_029046 [Paulownia fortunei]|nr:hypothetical protein Pfo_029046 [Paulownia fortunei]